MNREQMMKRFDTDGDGVISDAERQSARSRMMKRFDLDGDGVVSDEERQAARASMQDQGGKGGKGGKGKGQPPPPEQ